MTEAELFAALETVNLESVWNCLKALGVEETFMPGLQVLCPDKRMVGRATTMRCTPVRKDLQASLKLSERGLTSRVAAVHAKPGDVVVIDMSGVSNSGMVGDLVVEGLRAKGGVGLICYGGIRDMPAIQEMGLPVYCTAVHAAAATNVMCVEYNGPVHCAGVTVAPGDILLGDGEGVLVIPPSIAEEAVTNALDVDDRELYIRDVLRSGKWQLEEAYPMNAEVEAAYQEFKKQQGK